MTLDEFKSGNYAIQVTSYDGFVECMQLLEHLGFTWRNGKKFSEETLSRESVPGYCYYSAWKNEEGVTRYSDRYTAYYIITDGNKLSKRTWNSISESNLTKIHSGEIISMLCLDVDEDGFEREIM